MIKSYGSDWVTVNIFFGIKGFVMNKPSLVHFWRFCPRMDATRGLQLDHDWPSVHLSWRKIGRVSILGPVQLQ